MKKMKKGRKFLCPECGKALPTNSHKCSTKKCGRLIEIGDYGDFDLIVGNKDVFLTDSKGETELLPALSPHAKGTITRIVELTGAPSQAIASIIGRLQKAGPVKKYKERKPEKIPKKALALANLILEGANPIEYIVGVVNTIHAGDEAGIRVEWISALSGQIVKKIRGKVAVLNLWGIGKSAKGKSHLKWCVIGVLPTEYYEVFTSASAKSLFYYVNEYGPDSLDKVLIYLDEVEASEDAFPLLRSLTGQVNIPARHLTVLEGKLLDMLIKGTRVVWFTSVETMGKDQIRNRFLHTNPDESGNQDDRVFNLQDAIERRGKIPPDPPFLVCKAMTRLIVENTKDLRVKIPFEINWPFKIRRFLYPMFLSTIKVITKIHFKHREVVDVRDKKGEVVKEITATVEDFYMAKELWTEFEESIIMRVSSSAIEVLEKLSYNSVDAMTHAELSAELDQSTRWIQVLAKKLVDEGLASSRKRSREGPGRYAWEYWRAQPPNVDEIHILGSEDWDLMKEGEMRKALEQTDFEGKLDVWRKGYFSS